MVPKVGTFTTSFTPAVDKFKRVVLQRCGGYCAPRKNPTMERHRSLKKI